MRKWSNEELAEIMEYFAQPSGIFCTFWKGVEVRKAQCRSIRLHLSRARRYAVRLKAA
jgi:hypothetical protein